MRNEALIAEYRAILQILSITKRELNHDCVGMCGLIGVIGKRINQPIAATKLTLYIRAALKNNLFLDSWVQETTCHTLPWYSQEYKDKMLATRLAWLSWIQNEYSDCLGRVQ
jgi:hypothetical protein